MKLQQVLILLCLAVIFESVYSDNIAFVKIGTYQGRCILGIPYKKSFYLPRYFRLHNWHEAMQICKNLGMNLATFDNLAEFQAAQRFLLQNLNLINDWVFVGGAANTPRSKTDWYWAETNQKISFAMPWEQSPDVQPDFNQNNEWCLSLGSRVRNNMLFNDIDCYAVQNFLCSKRELF